MSFFQSPTSVASAPLAPAGARAGRWESVAAALCLVQFSEPLFAAIAQAQGLTEPPAFARSLFAPIYAFLAWVTWRDRKLALAAASAAPLLIGLLGLAFISALWSIDSGATLRRSVWLGLSMLFGFYLAWRNDWPRLVETLAGAFIVLIAGSFAAALLAPGVGTMPVEHVGAWSGLWTHKNTLGGIMALGAGIAVAAAWVAPERRALWLSIAAGAVALVLLSTSKTALIAGLLGLAIMAACMMLRCGPVQAILVAAVTLAALIVAASVVLLAPDLLVSAIGRDLTLTGRTDIWNASASAVAAQPWLGYGYYAFWLPDNGPAYWVREAVRWRVASAHSGWLELALGLGRVGIALFALQLTATLVRGARAAMDARSGLWAPALLAVFALYTLSESHVLQANNLFWIIYVAVTARLALDAREAGTRT